MTRTDKNTIFTEVCEQLNTEGFNGIAKVLEMLMNAAMEIERAKAIGAEPYERTQRRKAHSNGFKKRKFHSRMGELDLKIPQVRGLAFYPGCLEKGQRSEKALKAAVAEMYLNGVSTRKVTRITEYLCGFEISSSQVSKGCITERFYFFKTGQGQIPGGLRSAETSIWAESRIRRFRV